MNDPIPIDLNDEGRLVDPPIIDFLYLEPALHAYVAEFVPDPQISSERTEAVYIPQDGDDGRHIKELVEELGHLLRASSPVGRIFHKGSGNFGFYLRDNSLIELHDFPSPTVTQEIYDVLQVISNFVQFAFLEEKKSQQPSARP
ncbi:MAG TPA: hypothetical protein VFC46_17790 [Humisphaera sp.]|nr:hypothetical protein [Humisphaera sp.]